MSYESDLEKALEVDRKKLTALSPWEILLSYDFKDRDWKDKSKQIWYPEQNITPELLKECLNAVERYLYDDGMAVSRDFDRHWKAIGCGIIKIVLETALIPPKTTTEPTDE